MPISGRFREVPCCLCPVYLKRRALIHRSSKSLYSIYNTLTEMTLCLGASSLSVLDRSHKDSGLESSFFVCWTMTMFLSRADANLQDLHDSASGPQCDFTLFVSIITFHFSSYGNLAASSDLPRHLQNAEHQICPTFQHRRWRWR